MNTFELSTPIKKCESFYIVEDRPECSSPQDKRIQEVIRPAMLVVSEDGHKYLIFEDN